MDSRKRAAAVECIALAREFRWISLKFDPAFDFKSSFL
jgi:hypothetical protein